MNIDCKQNTNWLNAVQNGLQYQGFAIVENALDKNFIETTKSKMLEVEEKILNDIGLERLQRAKELGVLRLMMAYDDWFFRFLEVPEILSIVDATVSDTAIMHLQNGFILPPNKNAVYDEKVFQQKFHMDFRRVLNGYMTSLNILVTLSPFTKENGGTLFVPGTHQQTETPDPQFLSDNAIAVNCPAGAFIVFDSTLWHAAGDNTTDKNRLGINHQFTRSYFKQQIDYVRAVGDEKILSLPERTQQLLGYYTRLPTSLDDYYVAPQDRLYRANQG